ncbi:MAG: NifU family protein [Propionibacteriaceae bacterium]|jgi:Fe-S cluster biogenesis protein NfuA|nr:NifU family protein [Propionibacteriaceae bacterium]
MSTDVFLAQVEEVLAGRVRPVLHQHGGDVSLESVEGDVVHVRLLGECSGCPAADMSMQLIVKEELQDALPQIKDVVLNGGVSDELIDMAKQLLHRPRYSQPPPRLAS